MIHIGTSGYSYADWKGNLNSKSLEVLTSCRVEPGLKGAAPGSRYQFERMGYFCADPVDSKPGNPVFNRTVTLRDTWARIQKAAKGQKGQKGQEKQKKQKKAN